MLETNIVKISDKTVSDKVVLKPQSGVIKYRRVELVDNGYFVIPNNCQVEIEELVNKKSNHAIIKYEFLIQPEKSKNGEIGMDGEDNTSTADVKIIIHNLNNTVHVKSLGGKGGNGGNGIKGGNGGNGADGYYGGCGGNGGSGGNGGNGGKGGPAPNVTIEYTPSDENAEIIILSRDDQVCLDLTSFGGEGGKGGTGGAKGSGGKGGLNLCDKTRANNGDCGEKDGNDGNNGENGEDGKIELINNKIELINNKKLEALQNFKKKLDNINGQYALNFANDEDCEYFFEQYGGEDRLKEKFPSIYKSFLKTRNNALTREFCSNAGEPEKETYLIALDKFFINEVSVNMLGTENASLNVSANNNPNPIVTIQADLNCLFIDKERKIMDTKDSARPWTGVSVNVSIRDEKTRYYLIRYSDTIAAENQLTTTLKSDPTPLSMINNKNYKITSKIQAKDPNGDLHEIIENRDLKVGNAANRHIMYITLEHPKAQNAVHLANGEIVMLYGRTNQQEVYKYADYKGGDYVNNSFDTTNKKVHLILPMKGEFGVNSYFKPIGLDRMKEEEVMGRPVVTYSYKEQILNYRDDIIQNDDQLYEDVKGCYSIKEERGKVFPVTFDIKYKVNGRSDYDWHSDIEGEMDGNPKTVMLEGGFSFISKNEPASTPENEVFASDQITIRSIDKSNLAALNREYYKYLEGSNTIYIPPITIYWGCFGIDTKIRLFDGTEKSASEIRAGDVLISYDNKALTVSDIITGNDVSIYHIKTDKGETKVSGGHPLMRQGEFARANDIKVNDRLNIAGGGTAVVNSVEVVDYNNTVYNFVFEDMDEGTYLIADGFYSGDLKMQNRKEKQPDYVLTTEQKEFIAEMMMHTNELKTNMLY